MTKLSYRGVSYEHKPTPVEVVDSDKWGQYRGQAYNFARPGSLPVPQPVESMKYRGAAYRTTPTGGTETLQAAQPQAVHAARAIPVPVQSQSPRAMHTKRYQVNESAQAHRNNILAYLQHRIEVARAKGDNALLQQLEQEMQLLV
jgi:hypothetical protein